jgi:hypothetical protein
MNCLICGCKTKPYRTGLCRNCREEHKDEPWLRFLENGDELYNSKRRAKYHSIEVLPFSATDPKELGEGAKVL